MQSTKEAVPARLLTVLDEVSAPLTAGSLRAFDAQVELAGHQPGLVAGDWLRAHGLMPKGDAVR